MDNLINRLKAKQRAWAVMHNISVDEDGYCQNVNANLYQPLKCASRRDFESGDGSELGREGKRGKMQALHSSSALACSFFDYWRCGDLEPLAKAFGTLTGLSSLEFEKKIKTGLRGNPPNLDVVLYGTKGTVFAIESKFTEWITGSRKKGLLSSSYFPEGGCLWRHCGLDGCQQLAEDLHDGRVQFELLGAAQLLKHMLGLAKCKHQWKLFCLWYGPPDPLADQHARELDLFSQRLGPDSARFEALTYQELFDRLCRVLAGDHSGWQSYMHERYF